MSNEENLIVKHMEAAGWSNPDLLSRVNERRELLGLKPLKYSSVHNWTAYGSRPSPENLDILAALLPLSAEDVLKIQGISVDPAKALASKNEAAPE